MTVRLITGLFYRVYKEGNVWTKLTENVMFVATGALLIMWLLIVKNKSIFSVLVKLCKPQKKGMWTATNNIKY